MTKSEQLENIHDNLVNGNRRDCVKQIKEYGLYDFWQDYKDFLRDYYSTKNEIQKIYDYFTDLTISYFRITNR